MAISLHLRVNQQIKGAVAAAAKRFSRIDVIVNHAGHDRLGAVEEAQDVEIASVFENKCFRFAARDAGRAPFLREQRSGHVVNLSSIGGLVGLPGWVSMVQPSLRSTEYRNFSAAQLPLFGFGVTMVEPGPFRTDFLGGSLAPVAGTLPDYDQIAGRRRSIVRAITVFNGRSQSCGGGHGECRRDKDSSIAFADRKSGL